MLNVTNSSVNYNGSSIVNDESIATFSAGYAGEDVYFSIQIDDLTAAVENKSTLDTDLIAFKDQVLSVINSLNN